MVTAFTLGSFPAEMLRGKVAEEAGRENTRSLLNSFEVKSLLSLKQFGFMLIPKSMLGLNETKL